MGIFNISFNQKAIELLPPDKRQPVMIAWVKSMLAQLQYNQYSLMVDYKTGADYPTWSNISPYNKFDRVIYGQSVYESLSDNNNAEPTDAAYWRLYQLFFTGVDTRVKYNGERLVLEYGLNDRFQSTFRQPPAQSDIYITVNEPSARVFQIGATEKNSSLVYSNKSSEYVVNSYTFATFYNAVVNIPTATFEAISDDVDAREKIVRGFIDKILPAGIIYQVQTY